MAAAAAAAEAAVAARRRPRGHAGFDVCLGQGLPFQLDGCERCDALQTAGKPDSSSGFTQVGSESPRGRSVLTTWAPLYARLDAQYILQSCNTAGCTDSSNVSVSGTLVAGIGYVKASNAEANDRFGYAVSLVGCNVRENMGG